MAYLEDIPKYAFGTAYAIDWGAEGADNATIAPGSGSGSGAAPSQASGGGAARQRRSRAGAKFRPDEVKQLVAEAIRLGCRHFDCAPLYETQPLVGAVMREATARVPRQQFFFTTKVPPNMMRAENLERSVRKSIDELQVNYLDLVLLHAPFSTKHLNDSQFYPLDAAGNLMLDDDDDVEGEGGGLLARAWRQLAELKRRGLTRYVGLSNVNLEQLIKLNELHQVDVVQNEYHIYHQNREIFDYCEEIDVHFEAYAAFGSPLEARRRRRPCCFREPVVRRVARENKLTIGQVIVQWIHQQPLSYVVRCDNFKQLQENLAAIKRMVLPLNDLIDLDTLNRDARIYFFDEHRGVEQHREYPFKRQLAAARQRRRQLKCKDKPAAAAAAGANHLDEQLESRTGDNDDGDEDEDYSTTPNDSDDDSNESAEDEGQDDTEADDEDATGGAGAPSLRGIGLSPCTNF